MSSPFVIRTADPEDAPGINLIYRQWHEMSVWERSRPASPPDFSTVSEAEKIFVAIGASDMVLGVISVWEPEQFIHHLYVHVEFRRCGIGSALLDSLTGWLPRPWSLKCSIHNTAALKFYERNGWQKVEMGENAQGHYWLLRSAAPNDCAGVENQ